MRIEKFMRFARDMNRLGDAVFEQAWAVLMDGEDPEEQNSNAMKYAAEVLRKHGFEDEARDISVSWVRRS